MHLVQILLPIADNAGNPFDRHLLDRMQKTLTERFGGFTAFTRVPAEGLWKEAPQRPPQRDDIVVYEVMTDNLDTTWWTQFRRELEASFEQQLVVIRAHPVQLL